VFVVDKVNAKSDCFLYVGVFFYKDMTFYAFDVDVADFLLIEVLFVEEIVGDGGGESFKFVVLGGI